MDNTKVEERFSIRLIRDGDWPEVQRLIHDFWNENHIFTKSMTLLRWHYMGYGTHRDQGAFAIYDGEEMIGFRLMIPIRLRVPRFADGVCESAVSTMYFLKKEYRGQKLGLKMQFYVMERWGSYMAIASNLKTSAPIYKKSGAYMLDKMYHYVLPLSMNCRKIMPLIGDADFSIFKGDKPISPTELSVSELEMIWRTSIKGVPLVSLDRSADFWEWRYKSSPIYKYLFWGGVDKGGVIVGRVCDLYNDDGTKKDEKVFRILECIPINPKAWGNENGGRAFSLLLNGVLAWAQANSCVAAEFYLSTSRLSKVLSSIGFVEVNVSAGNERYGIYEFFEPCLASARLSNVTVFLRNYSGNFDFEDTYFTLSDADQDRPNVL